MSRLHHLHTLDFDYQTNKDRMVEIVVMNKSDRDQGSATGVQDLEMDR